MGLFSSAGGRSKRIGLSLDANTLTCAVVKIRPSGQPVALSVLEQKTIEEPSQLQAPLQEWVRRYNLKNCDCFWSISSDYYQTYQVEAPNVPQNELRSAISWQLREQIDIPLEQAVIEAFLLPEKLPGSAKVNAVVVRKTLIEQLIEVTQSCGLKLNRIDIEELALGHCIESLCPEGQIVAYIGENPKGLLLNFFIDRQLAFSRQLSAVSLPRQQTAEDEFSLDDESRSQTDIEDAFLLEVQRTLDYFESQVARQPIQRLLVQNIGESTAYLVKLLDDTLGMKVESVDIEQVIEGSSEIDSDLLYQQLAACGVTLVGDVA